MKELTIEEKANAYDNVRNKIAARFGNNVAQEIFSEYEESEDERIRKSIIRCLKGNMPDNDYRKEYIAWLEKQVPKVLIGARKDVALSIMNFLDRNTLGMDLSGMERADLESAVVDSDWSKVYDYMKKKLEKQGHIDCIIEKAKTEKQRVIITETDGNANIGWDTRSLEDARKLLECGLQYVNTELEKQGEQTINNIGCKGQKEINLVEILKHYPKETELYSPLYGRLWLAEVDEKNEIITCYKHHLEEGCTRAVLEQEDTVSFYSNGTTGLPDFNISKDCMLFLYDIEKQSEQKTVDDIQKPTDIKIHEGDKNNPYDMSFEEAQDYISERGFDICCTDYPVFVDGKYILQTIGNILKWADDNPKRELFDNIEPKFKVGDWITSDEGYINDDFRPCKIVGISDGCYTIQTINGYKGYNTFKMWENEYRLWSIEDAKPGDVLFQDLMCGKTFIYNGVNPDMAILYSFIINNDGEDVLPYRIGKPNTGIGYIEENKNIIHPATKEQRDMLFQKMHEAGYTFDFEKKELKKIESLTDFEKAFKGMCCDKNKQFAKECCKTLLELAKKQLQSKRNEFELDEISYKVGVKRVLENPESYGLTKNRLKLSTSDIKALEDIMNGNSNPTSYLVLQSIINQLKNT